MACCSTLLTGISVFLVLTCLYLIKQWARGRKCTSTARLNGKTIIITGANTGIGKETAIDLARRGGRMILGCRDESRGLAAVREVRYLAGVTSDKVVLKLLDLNSFDSVRRFADAIKREEKQVDILVNNAGVMFTPYTITEDGHEQQFQVNHLSHFLLTNLLLDKLKAAPKGRIINVSSAAYALGKMNFEDLNGEKGYNRLTAYLQSKLANVLFTRELARRLKGTKVTTYSLHPGLVLSDIQRHLFFNNPICNAIGHAIMWPVSKNTKDGAQTSIFCSVDESVANESGLYYSDCARKTSSALARDDAAADKLWRISEKMVGLSK